MSASLPGDNSIDGFNTFYQHIWGPYIALSILPAETTLVVRDGPQLLQNWNPKALR
jgi:hypothetical protein